MIREGKFGPQEAISLITITIVSRVFFTSPGILVRYVGTATWYMTLISAAVAAFGFTFVYLLLKRFPGKDIVEIFEITFGRVIGFVFSAILMLFFIISPATVLREFIEVIKVYVLPLSPPSYLIGIAVVGIVILGILGLETQVRLSRLLAPLLLVSFILVIVLSFQNFDFHRITPILGYGVPSTLYHGFSRSSVYGYVVILAVIAGSLQGNKHIKRIGYTSIILSCVLISAALLAFTLTFPYYTAQEITSPMYQMTALIDYGRFIQRIDPIFLFIWNISTLIALSIEVYAASSIYCKMFRIQDIRPVIVPVAITAFTIAMIPRDFITVTSGYVHYTREYGWTVFFVPPLIALITAIIRKKKGVEKSA